MNPTIALVLKFNYTFSAVPQKGLLERGVYIKSPGTSFSVHICIRSRGEFREYISNYIYLSTSLLDFRLNWDPLACSYHFQSDLGSVLQLINIDKQHPTTSYNTWDSYTRSKPTGIASISAPHNPNLRTSHRVRLQVSPKPREILSLLECEFNLHQTNSKYHRSSWNLNWIVEPCQRQHCQGLHQASGHVAEWDRALKDFKYLDDTTILYEHAVLLRFSQPNLQMYIAMELGKRSRLRMGHHHRDEELLLFCIQNKIWCNTLMKVPAVISGPCTKYTNVQWRSMASLYHMMIYDDT